MMRKGGETPDEEKARFKESRRFCKHVAELLGGQPDIVFEHVGKATFPTSVLAVKPFGKVVICGATSGYTLDFDVRYLWMRQKQIIGSHFANAYECNKANELIEQGKIRPVLWKTLPFEGVAEAHQLMRDNKHQGKIAILVGAEAEGEGKTAEGPGAIRRGGGCLMAESGFLIPWYATGFRGDSFEEALQEIAPVALRYGATQYWIYRLLRRPLPLPAVLAVRGQARLRAVLVRAGVLRLAGRVRELVHGAGRLRADEARRQRARRPGAQRQRRRRASALLERSHSQPRVVELLPVELGGLLEPAPDHRLARRVDGVGVGVALLDADPGDRAARARARRGRTCCGRRCGRSRASCPRALSPARRCGEARSSPSSGPQDTCPDLARQRSSPR